MVPMLRLLLAGTALLTAAPANAQNALVVQSTSRDYPAGRMVDANQSLPLAAHDRLLVLLNQRTRQVCGPGPVTLNAPGERCARQNETVRRGIGATRSQPPSPYGLTERVAREWAGTVCLTAGGRIGMFRPDYNTSVRFTRPDGMIQEFTDTQLAGGDEPTVWIAWPDAVPVAEGTRLDAEGATYLIRIIPAAGDDEIALLTTLVGHGCTGQASRLISGGRSFSREDRLASRYIEAMAGD